MSDSLTKSEDPVLPGSSLIELESDLNAENHFGQRGLIVLPGQVQVKDASGATTFRIDMADIAEARNEPLVGGGRLEVKTKKGEILPIISYTNTSAALFSEAARGIEQLAKGETLNINLKREKTRCDKCGGLLPEKDGVCPKCVNRGKTMLRIARFLGPYKKQAIGLALMAFCTTMFNLLPPYLQGRIINEVMNPRANLNLLWMLMSMWLGQVVMASNINLMRDRTNAFVAANIAADLRSTVYRAIEFLQLTFFDKKQVGAIASRVTSDTDRVWGFLVEGVPFFLLNGLTFLGVIVVLFVLSPIYAAAVLAPIPIVVIIGVTFWKPMSQMFHKVSQKWGRFHTHLNESLSGIRVVKAFAREDTEFKKFQSRNHELRDAGVAGDQAWFTVFAGMMFFTTIGTLLSWAVGGYLVVKGQLKLGDFWMLNAFLLQVYGPLQWFAAVNNWFSRAMAGADRIFEIVDMTPERYGKREESVKISGEVEFDNVRFGYDKSNPVLKNINFVAKPGEMIGLVGKSGAGKSTTINLIARFYEPDSGTIKIDGQDYRDMPLQGLREQIGIVLQEPFLFNGTIADNIAYGRPGATMEEIIEASRAANAHNFILSKPDGYDTMVGERGAKLSGGERQRVSIARAILHDPKILILDEATSSVDVETEKQIQQALAKLVEGRTTFAIAHRLSTLREANKLIVLERGEIAEMGSHEELMAKKGVFYNLVQTQIKVQEIIGYAYTEGDEEPQGEVDWQ